MDSTSSVKCLRNECIDRISDLPDSILGKILSYLPIKDVIATSILSTRWKPIFPSFVPLTELDLNDSYMLHGRPRNSCAYSCANFADFVDKLLNVTLRDGPCVERVIFSIENYFTDSVIVSWVRGAVRLNVKHFGFVLLQLDHSEALFNSLNGYKTLEELELGKDFELCFPQEFILPNLKRLSLYELVLGLKKDSFDELIDTCPVLNELRITNCYFTLRCTLNIKHPILEKLFIDGCYNESRCLVVIDAPNLETFVYEGPFHAEYGMKNTNSLHLVCIDFDYYSEETYGYLLGNKSNCLAKLVMACSSTTRLSLSGNSMMALYRSSVSLPTFPNLICLVLGHMGTSAWKMLKQFVKSAPNLTTLTFEEGLESAGGYVGFKSPFNLPCILELHVKKIEIWEFKWRPNEIRLMQYLLKDVKVLQELIIYCLPYENTSKLEKLSTLLRHSSHSSACQVLFRDKTNRENFRDSRENWPKVNDFFL